jgi:hypothetical protein
MLSRSLHSSTKLGIGSCEVCRPAASARPVLPGVLGRAKKLGASRCGESPRSDGAPLLLRKLHLLGRRRRPPDCHLARILESGSPACCRRSADPTHDLYPLALVLKTGSPVSWADVAAEVSDGMPATRKPIATRMPMHVLFFMACRPDSVEKPKLCSRDGK